MINNAVPHDSSLFWFADARPRSYLGLLGGTASRSGVRQGAPRGRTVAALSVHDMAREIPPDGSGLAVKAVMLAYADGPMGGAALLSAAALLAARGRPGKDPAINSSRVAATFAPYLSQ